MDLLTYIEFVFALLGVCLLPSSSPLLNKKGLWIKPLAYVAYVAILSYVEQLSTPAKEEEKEEVSSL